MLEARKIFFMEEEVLGIIFLHIHEVISFLHMISVRITIQITIKICNLVYSSTLSAHSLTLH